jgi:hypothetical protein
MRDTGEKEKIFIAYLFATINFSSTIKAHRETHFSHHSHSDFCPVHLLNVCHSKDKLWIKNREKKCSGVTEVEIEFRLCMAVDKNNNY